MTIEIVLDLYQLAPIESARLTNQKTVVITQVHQLSFETVAFPNFHKSNCDIFDFFVWRKSVKNKET